MKYPCTVIADRYNGTYSKAAYLAFPLDFYDVPEDVSGEDNECIYFWDNYAEPVGKGASAKEAIDNLVAQMQDDDDDIHMISPSYENNGGIEYIRKDALLEWANSWLAFKRSGIVLDDGFSYAMEELIKKINEM